MNYIIYLDTFFIINFTMDFISIMLCRKIKNIRHSIARGVAAAALGGIYACVYITFPYGNYFVRMIFSYIIAVSLMVLIAFGFENKKRFINNVLLLYIVSFLSGGAANVLYFRIGIKNMPLIVLMTAFTGTFAAERIDRKKRISEVCYEVTVENRGVKIVTCALADTGNSLKEPYMGKPVNILESKEAIKLIKGDDIHLQKGYMKIPFHSLGKENGLLDGFEVEKIYINMTDEVVCRERVVIGVYNGQLSSDESYKMILNPEMLKEI
ncbi:MAG: sigma-E processing peptidase SpoIIGA [Lachnospiraceae bacterium]|nr:sigma-E processing peptidase SpoIIGA [Lachnospiraceae bacterium]